MALRSIRGICACTNRIHLPVILMLAVCCLQVLCPPVFSKTGPEEDVAVPCLSWIDSKLRPHAVLLCIHGLGLYSGSYAAFGKRMSGLGFATYAIDVRGFGSWMKSQGHEKVDFNGCLADVQETLIAIRHANPGLPVFLLGESMGGAIALRATAIYPDLVDGLISSVPAGERFQQKRTDLKVALHILEGYNKPFDVGEGIIDQATKNPRLRERWEDNPLDNMKLSPHELIQFQRFMNENHDSAKKIKNTPVLIMQGCRDKLVRPEGTVELFEELATSDKEMVLVANSEHLILEDWQFSPAVIKTVRSWIDARLDKAKAGGGNFCEVKLLEGKRKMAQGQFDDAVKLLEQAVSKEPQNSEVHVVLGQAYAGNNNIIQAKEHFRQAIRTGHGGAHAQEANGHLLGLPDSVNAPITGPDSRAIASSLGLVPANQADGAGARKPVILYFCAEWCLPCKQLEAAIARAKVRYGDEVKFVRVDVDNPDNRTVVEKYAVGPVPTLIFLRPNGEVATYSIGFSNIANVLNQDVQKILGGR